MAVSPRHQMTVQESKQRRPTTHYHDGQMSAVAGCSNRDAESQCYHVWHGVLDKDVSPSCTNSKQARAAWWSE